MHEQPNPSRIDRDAQQQGAILTMLLSESSLGPWSADEIAREMGRDVTDSLRRLYGAGLIHRLDGFVWASRAAVLADEIAL
jgi:predicted transcriptional regulator